MAKKTARRAGRAHLTASRPPALISIAPESGGAYIALDATHQVWRGHSSVKSDGSPVIIWRRVASDFSGRNEAGTGSVEEEEELEP